MLHSGKSHLSSNTDSESTTLFIRNIPFDLQEERLKDFFSECGTITHIFIKRKDVSSSGKTFGFVSFSSKIGAENALLLGEQKPFYLSISYARRKKDSNCFMNSVDSIKKHSHTKRNSNTQMHPAGFAHSQGPSPVNNSNSYSAFKEKETRAPVVPSPIDRNEISPRSPVSQENSPTLCFTEEYRSESRCKNFGLENDTVDHSDMPPLTIYTVQCSVCKKLGCFCCSACKLPYCTEECQRKDWLYHKLKCSYSQCRIPNQEQSGRKQETINPKFLCKKNHTNHEIENHTKNMRTKSPYPNSPPNIHANSINSISPNGKGKVNDKRLPETTFQANINHRNTDKKLKENQHSKEIFSQRNVSPILQKFKANEVSSLNFSASATEEAKIVFVENLQEIWLQKVSDQNLLAEIGAELEILSKVKTILNSPSEFDICCTYFQGNLYRAKILKVSPSGNCNVFYIDYGNTDTVEMAELYHISSKLAKYPALAISCKLGNVAFEGIEKQFDVDFLNWMTDMVWNVRVINFHEDKFEVDLFNNGIKLADDLVAKGYAKYVKIENFPATLKDSYQPSSDPAEVSIKRVFDEVPTPVTYLKVGSEISVSVTCVTEQGFYGQLKDESLLLKLQEMQASLQKPNSRGQDIAHSSPMNKIAIACSKKYGNEWFRSYVIQANNGKLLVRYIDYGDEEEVTQLLELSAFKDTCSPVLYCDTSSLSLEERKLFPECAEVIGTVKRKNDELILDVMFNESAKFSLKVLPWWQGLDNTPTEVAASSTSVNVNKPSKQHLPSSSNAKNLNQSYSKEQVILKGILEETVFSVTSRTEVKIVWINTANELFAQKVSLISSIGDLESRLNKYCNSQTNFIIPKEGDIICSLYDNKWYRCCVKKVLPNNSFKIYFIDYGNEESVSFQNIRPIPEEYSLMPPFCYPISLYGLKELLLTSEILSLIMNGTWELEVKDPNVFPVDVKLFRNDKSLCDFLTEGKLLGVREININSAELAVKLKKQPILKESFSEIEISEFDGSLVKITHADSTHSLYLQRVSDSDNIASMMEKLNCLPESDHVSSEYVPVAGEMVCAKYNCDQLWYRGSIEKIINKNTLDVLFVDYGNIDKITLNNIKALPEEYSSIPFYCKKVSLYNVSECSLSKEVSCHLQKDCSLVVVNRSDPAEVKLFHDEVCLNDLCLQNILPVNNLPDKRIHSPVSIRRASMGSTECKRKVCKVSYLQKVNLPMKGTIEVAISFVENSEKVFLHKTCDLEKLDEMTIKLNSHCNQEVKSYTPAADEVIAAKCSDGVWYRGHVTKILSSESCCIQFIDFGNTEEVKSNLIRFIPKEFTSYPIFCVPVRLLDGENMPQDLMQRTFHIRVLEIVGGLQAIKFEGSGTKVSEMTSNSNQLPVHIEDSQSSDINAKIITNGTSKGDPVSYYDCPMRSIPMGNNVDLLIRRIVSHDLIFCVPWDEKAIHENEKLTEEINIHCKTAKHFYSPASGELVLAKCADNGKWQRAVILNVDELCCEVCYIDYGGIDSISKNDIQMMVKKFLKLPQLSFMCKLGGILINEQNADEINMELMKEIKTPCRLSNITVISDDDNTIMHIPSFREHLIRKGFAVS